MKTKRRFKRKATPQHQFRWNEDFRLVGEEIQQTELPKPKPQESEKQRQLWNVTLIGSDGERWQGWLAIDDLVRLLRELAECLAPIRLRTMAGGLHFRQDGPGPFAANGYGSGNSSVGHGDGHG